jgi:hypothetical protein
MSKPESFLVACDIGTSKVCVLIGEPNAAGSLDVIGKGAAANRGTRKGNIINVDATSRPSSGRREAEIGGVRSPASRGHLALPVRPQHRGSWQSPARTGRSPRNVTGHRRRRGVQILRS